MADPSTSVSASNRPGNKCDSTPPLTDTKIGMSFSFGKLKGPYGEATCNGVVPLLLPDDKFPVPSIVRNPSLMNELLEKFIPEYREMWPNLLDDEIESRLRDYITIAAFTMPTLDLGDPKQQGTIPFYTLVFTLDDIVDDVDFSLTYKDGKNISQFYSDLFKGKYTSLDKLINPTAAFRHMNAHIWAFYEVCKDNIPHFHERSEHFCRIWTLLVDAHAVRKESSEFSKSSKAYFRAIESGGQAGVELMALIFGLDIPDFIRQDFLFLRLNWHLAAVTGLMNDIFGLGRDIRLGLVKDSSILSEVVENGGALQQAFDNTLDELLEHINDMGIAVATLRKGYAAHEEMQEFLRLIEYAVDGQIRAYTAVGRYNTAGMRIVQVTNGK